MGARNLLHHPPCGSDFQRAQRRRLLLQNHPRSPRRRAPPQPRRPQPRLLTAPQRRLPTAVISGEDPGSSNQQRRDHLSAPLTPTLSLKGRGGSRGKRLSLSSLLPLREKVDRPKDETDEGCR